MPLHINEHMNISKSFAIELFVTYSSGQHVKIRSVLRM